MNKESRILAPKPIRRSLHKKGESMEIKLSGPKTCKINGNFFHQKEEDYFRKNEQIFNEKIKINNFEKDLENELCRESAKSEIFSILYKNETSFLSTNDTENSENFLRASLQPMRLSNPFLKNFSHDEEPNIDLRKLKTSSLFKSLSLVD